ncbi:hypothetical protein JKF63_07835 [Porcisia hertigi]|uniref:Uncharacterized protein n=1 Tax=Porcisia hertigi TaxID=2761500 RepID=A0A836YI56_9TRYP|nr:hypothetical protein JKF63_07835 [Porcisia hertigi]
MTTRVNLDFFAPPPEREQRVRERRAQQRASMFSWRHDFAESCFDPISGKRRPLKHVFNPVAKERFVGARDASSKTRNGGSGAAETEASPARPATAAVWESAAGSTIDRRRRWKQSGFTFPKDYFGKTAHFPAVLMGRSASAAPAGVRRVHSSHSKVYVPYLHDTIMMCEPLLDSAESRHSRGGAKSGVHAAADQLPPVHRAPLTANVVLAVTYNGTESRTRELQASMDARKAGLLNSWRTPALPSSSQQQQQQQQQPATHSHTTGIDSLTPDDDDNDETATFKNAGNTGGTTSGANCMNLPSAAQTTTWCDVVGPSMAVKQRALAIAGGVYTDLISTRMNATPATVRVPTCELAYTLRPSYVQSRLRRSANQRSSSSLDATTAGIVSECHSTLLDGTSGTAQYATAATSPMTTHAPALRTNGHPSNGVSKPPSERTVTRSPGNDSITATMPPTVVEVTPTDAHSASQRSCIVADRNSTVAARLSALSPTELASDANGTEDMRSQDDLGARTTSKASLAATVADTQVVHYKDSQCAASPLPNVSTAPKQPDMLNILPTPVYRTNNHTAASAHTDTYGEDGGDSHQRRRGHESDFQGSRRRNSQRQTECEEVNGEAQRGHAIQPQSLVGHGLPTESKEMRVYAVRVNGSFTNRDAPLLKSAEPQRSGIPVTLPPDWL